ncbi:response regulator transcription factor [Shouchella clausii]
MYKVLIADDEWMIREGVKNLIPWKHYGFEVASLACNGKDALEKYKHHKPDLVIADIRMPQMDGLSLLKQIRTENEAVPFLLLSGHADFHYAQEAIGHGVDGYLLKPLEEDELIEHLQMVFHKLEQRKQAHVLRQQSVRIEQERLLLNLLEGKALPQSVDISRLGLAASRYQIFLVHAGERDALEHLAEQIPHTAVPFAKGGDAGLLICHLQEGLTKSELQQWASRLLAPMRHGALGKCVHKMSAIQASYTAAKKLLSLAFYADKGSVISELPTVLQDEQLAKKPLSFYEERIYLALHIGEKEPAKQAVSDFLADVAARRMKEASLKAKASELALNVIQRLIASHVLAKDWAQKGYRFTAQLQEAEDFLQLRHVLLCLCDELAANTNVRSNDAAVKKMIDMIDSRYDENLRLETISAVLNYNSAYLGKRFKQETGDYFNTYLDKVRIHKSKQLLRAGCKVYEAAEKVGYPNVDYFHRKFKKYTGMSPSAFRKKG